MRDCFPINICYIIYNIIYNLSSFLKFLNQGLFSSQFMLYNIYGIYIIMGGGGGSNSINVFSPPDFRQTDTDENRQNRQKLFFALGRFLDAYY